DINTPDFKVYGQSEITAIKEHFYREQQIGNDFLEQWKDMKYELLQLKTKWLQFKDNVESNNMKIKFSPTEWVLRKIVKDYQHDEQFALVYRVAKVALVTPVTNAWPERGASAVKRIKTRSRSSMKSDLLNALLMISINGPPLKTKEYQELMEEVAVRNANEKHRMCPRSFISVVQKKSLSSSTQTVDIDELSEIEEAQKIDNHLQENAFFESDESDGDDNDDDDDDKEIEDHEDSDVTDTDSENYAD
ncbi:zinc finger 862-like, partial [Paramuricea clavata]